MDTSELTIRAVSVVLLFFIGLGGVVLVQSLRLHARTSGDAIAQPGGPRAAIRRYFGPVTPDLALLNPPARVVLEFIGALCGFPGFGWLMSSRIWIGLPMLIVGPAIVFGFYPAYLVSSGRVLDSPMEALEYLPFVAVASAAALTFAEARHARAARDAD
jgi:hypothetical protein